MGDQDERSCLLARLAGVLAEARNRKVRQLRERQLCQIVGALKL